MTVYLVGAGPGDPGLLTVRGRDVLSNAEIVLYDGLVDARVLHFAPPDITLVDVSKVRRGRNPCAARQEDINALLVRYGRTGAHVVRLKGGDPFVFGRGGEEALVLAAAGIPFEVVPGVSAAMAVPAYAGIPVTQRGVASSVAIVTGHEAPDKDPRAAHVDWARLATATDTLVVLMGVSQLPLITEQLIRHGRPPDTPGAVIEAGATTRQRVIAGPLRDLPDLAAAANVRSPATIVVGEVVRLHRHLTWFAPPRSSDAPGEQRHEVDSYEKADDPAMLLHQKDRGHTCA